MEIPVRMPQTRIRTKRRESLKDSNVRFYPLARTLALELAPVRVNAITPGQIDTPLWRSRLSETEARAHFDRVAHAHPVGRVGTADDVAQAIILLMMNRFMTGAVLDIDGGWR